MSSTAAKASTRVDVERLSSLGERFRMWQKRQGRSYFKMPSHLWDDGFALVPIFGATRVARELGVNRDELLRRMDEAERPVVARAPVSVTVPQAPQATEDASPPAEFLDFEMQWPGIERPAAAAEAPAPAAAVPSEPACLAPAPIVPAILAPTQDSTLLPEEAVVEIVGADGLKLSIRIPVNHLMKASALVREFRSQQ